MATLKRVLMLLCAWMAIAPLTIFGISLFVFHHTTPNAHSFLLAGSIAAHVVFFVSLIDFITEDRPASRG